MKNVNMLINNFKNGLCTISELCDFYYSENMSKAAKVKLIKFILAYQNFGICE